MINEQLTIDFLKAEEYLNNHPAFNTEIGWMSHPTFDWYVLMQCKNGYYRYINESIDDYKIKLYKSDSEEIFKKYWNEREYKEIDDDINEDDEYYINYEKYFGYKWKYEKTIYCGELCIQKYVKQKKKKDRDIAYLNWMAYSGINHIEGDTFEEMVIKLAEEAKKCFGDFNIESFYTEEEKENHKCNDVFFHKEVGEGMYTLDRNPNYISVSYEEINKRWWKWYRNTEHYKQHWKDE